MKNKWGCHGYVWIKSILGTTGGHTETNPDRALKPRRAVKYSFRSGVPLSVTRPHPHERQYK